MPIWEKGARIDLQRNIERYAQDDPLTAWRVNQEVLERSEILDDQPGIGRPGRVRGTREFVVTGTPFILVYRIHGAQIEILRVLHGHQQWPPVHRD